MVAVEEVQTIPAPLLYKAEKIFSEVAAVPPPRSIGGSGVARPQGRGCVQSKGGGADPNPEPEP